MTEERAGAVWVWAVAVAVRQAAASHANSRRSIEKQGGDFGFLSKQVVV